MRITKIIGFFNLVFFCHISATILNLKTPEDVLRAVRKYLPRDARFLEAGAYDGEDSISLARNWPEGMIYSFEPIGEHYNRLVKQVQNIGNIKTYQEALGDYVGKANIFVSEWVEKPGIAGQSSSMLPPKEHLIYSPGVIFPRTEVVSLTTIDAWAEREGVDRIDMMWLDLQGVEYEALVSSPKMLATAKVIFLEVEYVEAYEGQKLAQDIRDFLSSQGFTLIGIRYACDWFGDYLFVRK